MLARILIFMSLTLLATLSAFAETPSRISVNGLASIKSIGIISAVGDTLNIGTNGPLLRLSMTHKNRPISDLGIDDTIEIFAGQKLVERFKIEQVKYDREKFSSVPEPRLFHPLSLPPIEDLIKTLSPSVDAYLVIAKDMVPFGVSDDVLRPGLNIGRGGFHENQYNAFAFVTVSLYDARTNKLLAKVVYPPPISRFWGGKVEELSFDGDLWPDDEGNFTQEQRGKLKKMFTDDLEIIVSNSIEQLGLLAASSK